MTITEDETPEVLSGVMRILITIGNVSELLPDEDIYGAGVTSIMVLPILLDLEDRYQVSIPDDRFIAARTPRGIASMILELRKEQ